MERFNALRDAINKKVSIVDKSNTVIDNWSPNNVRRVIVSPSFALIQYFVTGGKYRSLFDVVDMQKEFTKDMDTLSNNPSMYVPLLKSLVVDRVCSSVEEIVFCVDSYPESMLRLDANLDSLKSPDIEISNRFVRLAHMYLTSLPIKVLSEVAKKYKDSSELMYDGLVSESGDSIILSKVTLHKSDWWSNTSLRPKYYLMDNGVLADYFSKLKLKMEKDKVDSDLKLLDKHRALNLANSYLPKFESLAGEILSFFDKSSSIFDNASLVSKSEWAMVLNRGNICSLISRELSNVPISISDVKRVNVQGVLAIGEETSNAVSSLSKFLGIFYTEVLRVSKPTQSSDLLTTWGSLERLKEYIGVVFNIVVCISYLALVKYLARNTSKYATHHLSLLKDLGSVTYTISIISFLNTYAQDVNPKDTLNSISALEVKSAEFSTSQKLIMSSKILKSLSGV